VGNPLNDPAVRRRLAVLRHVEGVTGNVAMTCRYFGISRQLYDTWLRRYQAEGLDGLRDWSWRPKTCPHATDTEVVDKIVYLRRTYYFGPTKISMYLKRYHDVALKRLGAWRILKRLGLNRLPASQRYQRCDRTWKRYEKQQPGQRVQIDVTFVEPLTSTAAGSSAGTTAGTSTGSPVRSGRRGKYDQFTAIDDCTGLRVLRAVGQLGVVALT
jgi:transposase